MACAAQQIPTSRVATFDVTITTTNTTRHATVHEPMRTTWHARLVHRRTGMIRTFDGHVHGMGPTLTVDVAEPDATHRTIHQVNVHEFPESIARVLLRPLALADASLLSDVPLRR
jgi:hypothetical protein